MDNSHSFMDHTAQTPVINGTVKSVLGVKQEGILSCYIPGSRIELRFLLTKIHWFKDYVDDQILTLIFFVRYYTSGRFYFLGV